MTHGGCLVVNYVFWSAPRVFGLASLWPIYRHILYSISPTYIWVGFGGRLFEVVFLGNFFILVDPWDVPSSELWIFECTQWAHNDLNGHFPTIL